MRFVDFKSLYKSLTGFPGGASGKEPTCQCKRHKRFRFDPWVGKIPGGGHGNPLQYSCLESPIHRGAWRATVHGVAQSQAGLNTSTTRTWHLILKLISFLIPYEATLFPELLGGVPQAGRSGSCALAVCSSRSRPSSFCWASPRSISPHSFPMLCLF